MTDSPPHPNSYWLEPGRVLCGEYPRDFDDLEDHEGMRAILAAGIRVFLDLTEEGELKPYDEIAAAAARGLGLDPGSLERRSFPVRDVSVPRSPGHTRSILRALRSARHQGLPVYLHCWGGRGRTGTVAGCALREIRGLSGDEALAELALRWQACAKSSRGGCPETDQQRGYVQSWHPVWSPPGPRVRGALLGAAAGDALGVPVEFAGREARRDHPVEGMRGYGTHGQPPGTWSDDTALILATMEAWKQAGNFDPEAVMEQFALWLGEGRHSPHGEVFDVGIATSGAIRQWQSGVPARECGGTGEQSNGNGSLMRILPVALALADDPDLAEAASQVSALTHAHERSRFCCAFFCLAASELWHGGGIREAAGFAWEILDRRWIFSPGERERFERLRPDRLFDRKEDEIGSGGHVIDTLEAALWVNGQHDSYAEAVLRAVNLGGDTDTTGCVAGALAGLIHGEKGIPADWLAALARREDLEAAARDFAARLPGGSA